MFTRELVLNVDYLLLFRISVVFGSAHTTRDYRTLIKNQYNERLSASRYTNPSNLRLSLCFIQIYRISFYTNESAFSPQTDGFSTKVTDKKIDITCLYTSYEAAPA